MKRTTLSAFCDLKRLTSHNAKLLLFAHGLVLTLCVLILGIALLRAGVQEETVAHSSQPTADPDWSELIASMDKMHMAMGAIKRSRKQRRRFR